MEGKREAGRNKGRNAQSDDVQDALDVIELLKKNAKQHFFPISLNTKREREPERYFGNTKNE